MESGRHRSPYYRDNLNLSSHQYIEGVDSNPEIHDRQRPASVQDLEYGEMYDSGIQPHSTSPRLNNPYIDPLIEGDTSGIDHRTTSLDRRGEYYGTLRGNFDSQSERLTRKPINRQSYTLKSLSSNPGLSGILGSTNPSSGRRAHSYDMNLEKQGLTDYNSLLAAAAVGGVGAVGIGTNPPIYGYPTNPLLDYSSTLGVPTFPTIGGLDYATLQRSGVYSGLPQTQPTSIPAGLIPHNPTTDITTLQREYVRLQHELHVTREKLNACTISIRTFWSPELKRERAMRKEENAKYAILADHLHQLQLEKQTMLETLHNMESDLRQERDKRNRSRFSGGASDSDGLSELDLAKRQIDELTLENRQLKKSIEDADRRIANLKSSLNATEESLRRLVDAVKAGKSSNINPETTTTTNVTTGDGLTSVGDQSAISSIKLDRIEADRLEISRLRNQLNETSTRRSEAERQLIERNFELSRIKEDFDALLQEHRQLRQECETLRHDTRQTQTLQSLESKILTLENEIRLLEDEITRLRDDGLITPNTSTSSGIDDLDKTLQVFRSNERILKSKIEMLNSEISKRECELYTLQSRLEMTDKQHQDQNHHINVLKEQVNTREHKISMLTADVKKENLLEKKSKALNSAQSAKRQIEQELTELKDQMDIKDRKISLLQKKIENIEDLLNDKETQLATAQARLSRISTERVSSDGGRIGWEETLKDKDRQIERLKEARQRSESEIVEELETQKRLNNEFKNRLDILQKELDEKTTQLMEIRDETNDYRTSRFKLETEINQLQTQLTELEGQLNHYMENSSKLQTEVDRLLRTIDTEKFDKENQLNELKEELREAQNNLNNLKRSQQNERKKSSQQLEESRQREENAQSDNEILKGIITEKDGRIRELEQALRESVRLTAEREIYASGRDDETRHLEQQVRELRSNLEHFQRERNNLSAQLASAQEELTDRENQLKTLEQECFQNYLPELEKLRRSNHEANLRVAAMIKLTQGREHTLTDQDRAALSTIPLFPNISLHGTWSGMSGGLENIGATTGTGRSGYLAPYHTGSGGSLSPHLAGSAFQFIGNTSSSAGIGTVGATQRELDTKSARLNILETTHLNSATGIHDLGTRSPSSNQLSKELAILRKTNQELSVKFNQLQMELDERSRGGTSTVGAYDRLKSSTAKSHIEEIKRLNTDLDDLKHHVGYLQNTIKNRESRIETTEKESFKLRDELTNIRKQLTTAEAEVKSLRDDATEELARLRSTNQEQVTRIGHLEMKLDEKGHQLKSQTSEIRCQADEITRLQSAIEETNNRLSVNQKRAEEREMRLRKLENENHDLLDEIHGLRKGNTELESQIDSLRQRLLDRQESTESVTGVPLTSTRIYQPSMGLSTTSSQELDRLRKQYTEMKISCEQAQKSFEETQIQRTSTQPTHQLTLKIEELHKELERKEAQITCLNKQIDRQYTSLSTTPDARHTDSTNQQLLIADLQVRLRQAIEDRDIAREQLTTNLTRAETSTLDIQQQYMLDKQSLQQQITNLTQSVQNATNESERYQREFKQASSRVQQLSRQLQETQSNCDSIARQRDSTVTNIFGISSSTSGMRPASAGPGNYDNISLYGTTPGTIQLSREMDRLHRECEHLQNQLRTSQESEQEAHNLVDNLKNDIKNLTNDIKTQRELQTKSDEAKDKLTHTQQLLIEKTSQTQQQADELKRCQQLEFECNQLRNEIKASRNEVQHLQLQLDQLNREYQNQGRRIEQMTIELSTSQANTNQMKQELQLYKERNKELELKITDTHETIKESESETLNILRAELKDSQVIKQRLEERINSLQEDLRHTQQELDEKTRALDVLENTHLRNQSEEIINLQKELSNARIQIEELGGPIEPGSKLKGSPLKVEIDTLKKEISKREDAINRIEKECQEKHIHRIEAMQSQLRRFEEETANLNQVLDEQRVGLEERDRAQGSLIELEKLKAEHNGCKDKIEQLNKQANIALMELTAPKNTTSNQALEKLRIERDQLQQQQKQLSNTRAMLLEEKMSRR
ncbi:ELKS/RAB6-interacting/CAST family member 1 [Schistosoma bovis]|uniref:ELKS/RAB6-interacting/CAST family member 1 n=1 Tax=Schistosoma bovis TaxID=6184 RepID=A0A430QHG7_SCHBO|nr:ELKS/RAB6-interacting/CAST family member 1 [Schistosoma bovis]